MGVTYLLDTHVLLWLLGEPERVPSEIRETLADRANGLLVSAVSALEISTKSRLGKLHAPQLIDHWDARLDELGAGQLSISAAHGLAAGALGWINWDPFDRLLAAQALHENVTLVSIDRAFDGLRGVRLLNW